MKPLSPLLALALLACAAPPEPVALVAPEAAIVGEPPAETGSETGSDITLEPAPRCGGDIGGDGIGGTGCPEV